MAKFYIAKRRLNGEQIASGKTIIATVNRVRRYNKKHGRHAVYIIDADSGVVHWDQEAQAPCDCGHSAMDHDGDGAGAPCLGGVPCDCPGFNPAREA